MNKSFGEILDEYRGVGPGFDLLRLLLSIAIFVSHVGYIAGTRGIFPSAIDLILSVFGAHRVGAAGSIGASTQAPIFADGIMNMARADAGLTHPIVLSHVPMFFALSGFLVAGSAFRTKKVAPFLTLRVLRIFPALAVEVTLSALIIGSFLTTLSLSTYFLNPHFLTYLGNIIGLVQMDLPGVDFSPSGAPKIVNTNLWTLKGEFYCYLFLSAAMFTGVVYNRAVALVAFLLLTAAVIVSNLIFGYLYVPNGVLDTSLNVYYFIAGVVFFLWKDKIPSSWFLFIVSIALVYFFIVKPYGVFLAPIPLVYATVFIGTCRLPRPNFLKTGDYSYGIYLYGFPITQILIVSFPWLKGNYFGLLVPAIVLTSIFAFLSWHYAEKRFLKLKKFIAPPSARVTEALRPGSIDNLQELRIGKSEAEA